MAIDIILFAFLCTLMNIQSSLPGRHVMLGQ